MIREFSQVPLRKLIYRVSDKKVIMKSKKKELIRFIVEMSFYKVRGYN